MPTHPFHQGFLSEAIDSVKIEVRERYHDWYSLLLRVNEYCVDAQHSAEVDPSDSRSLLAAAHFARLLASVQSAVILLEPGLLSQAKSVLRMALESLFALAAIHIKPELAVTLAMSQQADKRTIADRILRWSDPELRAAVAARIDEAELRTQLESKARELKTFELAKAAEMQDWYLSLYSILSFPTHGAVSDLIAHLVINESGQVIALKNEAEVDKQMAAWAYAVEIEIRAAESFSAIFGLNSESVATYRTELRVLSSIPEA